MPLPASQSQDVDARFAVFLNPIRDLTKNWEVDIAKYLEEYLVELAEVQITFDGGETTMNFAEAAMLIQGTATVYSKKVEFLWQMVLQMLDLLSSKKSLDNRNDVDETKASEGNRNKTKDNTDEFTFLNNVKEGKNIDMKEDETEDIIQKSTFRFLPAMPLHLVEKEGEKSHMKIALFLKNMETFGYKDDFRINRSYLTPSGLLCLELPKEILIQRVCLASQHQHGFNDSIAGFLASEKGTPPEIFENEEILPTNELDNVGGDDDHFSVADMEAPPSPEPENEKQPPQVPEPVTPTKEDKNNESPMGYGLRKRAQKEIAPTKVSISGLLKPQDPHVETPANRLHRAGRLRKPMPCLCHSPQTTRKRSRTSAQKEKKEIASVESFIVKDLVKLVSNDNNNTKNPLGGIDPCLFEELAKEKSKKAAMQTRIRAKELLAGDASLSELEAEEEAKMEKKETNLEDEAVADLDFDDFPAIDDDPLNISLPVAHNDDAFSALQDGCGVPKSLNDSLAYEPGSDYEALVQKWVSEYVTNAQEHISSSDLTKRVNKWRQTITPKLTEEENRKNFDIHEYGSFILSKLPENTSASPIPFETVVEGKDPKETSRIFLSSLMLANTYNIELSQSREGNLEMDCLQLSFLSRVRHHEELEEHGPTSPQKNTNRKDKRKNRSPSSDESFHSPPISSQKLKKNKKKMMGT